MGRRAVGRMRQGFAAFAMLASLAGAANAMPDSSLLVADEPDYRAAMRAIAAGDFAAALPPLTALMKDYPRDAEVLNLMGYALRKTGRLDEALDHYQRALAREPKHLGANEYLGELYAETGRLDLARERLAILQAACGEGCEQTRELAEAIAKAERR